MVGVDIPPHDRAVCRAQAAKYRPSEAAYPERVFKLWKEGEDISHVSDIGASLMLMHGLSLSVCVGWFRLLVKTQLS